jgi:hypothetical protein
MTYYDRFGDRLMPRENRWVPSMEQTSFTEHPSALRLEAP